MLLWKQFSLKQCCCGAAMSFSPDGLWLAIGAEDGSVELWDPLSGKKVMDRGRHASQIRRGCFWRDSRTLVSGSSDGFCYVWDLRPPGVRSPADVGSLWDDLAGQDPLAAYQAMWAMSDSPDRATAACPPLEDLQQAALGHLSAAESETVAEHLLVCDRCVTAFGSIDVQDSFIEAMRQQPAVLAQWAVEGGDVEGLIAQVHSKVSRAHEGQVGSLHHLLQLFAQPLQYANLSGVHGGGREP